MKHSLNILNDYGHIITTCPRVRCSLHGQCKNGTCLCVTGWNGRHCTIQGCPATCSGHGACRSSFSGEWRCQCEAGWDGADCATRLETQCGDGLDNDGGW